MDVREGFVGVCSLVRCFAAFAFHQAHRGRKQNSMVSINKFDMLFSLCLQKGINQVSIPQITALSPIHTVPAAFVFVFDVSF